MIGSVGSDFLVGAICYGLATSFGIRLRDDLTVPTAAALAPAAAALTLQASEVDPRLMLVAPIVVVVTLMGARVAVLEIFSHVALFFATLGVLRVGNYAYDPASARFLVLAVGLTLAYSLCEVGRQKLTYRGHAHIRADLNMWWLLQGVLVCASALTVLVVERLGWPAFAAMAAVLGLTRHEFEGFALSRVALDQTLRAVERLSERARLKELEGLNTFD